MSEIARVLIENGASLALRNKDGLTASDLPLSPDMKNFIQPYRIASLSDNLSSLSFKTRTIKSTPFVPPPSLTATTNTTTISIHMGSSFSAGKASKSAEEQGDLYKKSSLLDEA